MMFILRLIMWSFTSAMICKVIINILGWVYFNKTQEGIIEQVKMMLLEGKIIKSYGIQRYLIISILSSMTLVALY